MKKILILLILISSIFVTPVYAESIDVQLTVTANGTVVFESDGAQEEVDIDGEYIYKTTFSEPGTYYVKIWQKTGTDETIEYDETVYTAAFFVSRNDNDVLTYTIVIDNGSETKPKDVLFENTEKEKPKGNVLVVYETEDGDTLEPMDYVCLNCEIGTDFRTEELSFEDYEFIRVEYPAECQKDENNTVTGKVKEGDIIIKYIYRKIPEPVKRSVLVVYKDIDTGEEIKDIEYVIKDGEVGTKYSTQQLDFDDYEFVKMADDSAPANGSVTEQDQTVIYLYRKKTPEPEKKYGSVLVVYKDEKTGAVLKEMEYIIKNGEVGTPYTTKQLEFNKYVFSKMDPQSAPKEGEVIEGEQTVIYLYKHKVGSVLVVYKTESGEVIKKMDYVVKDGDIGTSYTTTQLEFENYRFVRVEGDPSGEVVEGDTIVTYIYKKIPAEVKKGTLKVIYQTEDGTILKELNSEDIVGNPYSTNKLTFDGYSFSRMGDGSAEVVGKYIDGELVVVYIYKKNVIPSTPKDVVKVIVTGLLGQTYTPYILAGGISACLIALLSKKRRKH